MSNNPSDSTAAPDPTLTTDHQPSGAAQARVTSDELARALAIIEERKDAEAQRLAGTIPLGQAVAELGLEVTPEELLAEVKALRRKPAAPLVELPVQESVGDNRTPEAPVAATPSDLPVQALTHCPACSRKLLTQASALCNWCGAKIDDPKYQEQAARSRQELDHSELTQLETMVQEETRYGIFGRLKRRAKQAGSKNPLG